MPTDELDEFDSLKLDDEFVRNSTFKEKSLRRKMRRARKKRPPAEFNWRRILDRSAKTAAALIIAVLCGLIANTIWQRHENTSQPTLLSLGPTSSTSSTSTTLELALRTYTLGDCVIWDQSNSTDSQRDTSVVPCNQPHLLEYVGTATINNTSPIYPSDADMINYMNQLCTPEVETYLGDKLDPNGQFGVGDIHPLADSWSQGNRTLDCGVAFVNKAANPSHTLFLPFSIEAKGTDQHVPTPKGTCIQATPDGQTQGTVDCTAPHTIEVTGSVSIAGRINSDPNDTQMQALVGSQCDTLARSYLGKPLTGNLTSGWLDVSQQSWDSGDRNVDCDVTRQNGSTYESFSGSLAG